MTAKPLNEMQPLAVQIRRFEKQQRLMFIVQVCEVVTLSALFFILLWVVSVMFQRVLLHG
jgi:hypothetical protein